VLELEADGTRDAPGFGSITVLLAPGRYTVKLTVDGQSSTQPLEVLKDPHETLTDQEMRAAIDQLLAMQADLNLSADALNSIETMRAQFQTLTAQLATDRNNADVRARADSLAQRLITLESQLIDLRETGRGQDDVRYPSMAVRQISYLAGEVGASDFAPTAQQRSVQNILTEQVKTNRTALEQFIKTDLSAFNAMLRAKGLKPIEVTLPPIVF
jgi:DNA repair exonuclease SbcCD ATPase subunit